MPDTTTTRWIRNAADEYAVSRGCRFDERRAEHPVEFFRRYLRHSKGEWAGKPFEPIEWQSQHLLQPLFGWLRPDGTRRFREAYTEIPKKNGKSTLAAGVGLYLEFGDGEPGAEVYSVATKREQAAIVHSEAVNMVMQSPDLRKSCHINRSSWRIAYRDSYYDARASDGHGIEGVNAHGIVADELHAWKDRKFYNALKYAGRARQQPLLFMITTAGDDITGVCYELHEYALAVHRGDVLDDRFFSLVYAAANTDDWTTEDAWRKANPSIDVTLKVDDFADDVAQAKRLPSLQSVFRRYRLNQWIVAGDPWLDRHEWDGCGSDFTLEDLRGQECYAALDLSVSHDMSALALWFPEAEDEAGDYPGSLLCYFFLPEETIKNPGKPEEFRIWNRQGHLSSTPGNTIDYSYLERQVEYVHAICPIVEIAYDPYQAEKTTNDLSERLGIPRFKYPQTITHMAEPSAEFERLILKRKLRHNRNPVLSWQAAHVQVHELNGLKRPIKPKKGDVRKIDGIVAAVMALGRAMDPENRARLGGGQLLVEFV